MLVDLMLAQLKRGQHDDALIKVTIRAVVERYLPPDRKSHHENLRYCLRACAHGHNHGLLRMPMSLQRRRVVNETCNERKS
jgi:hypothetical protein